MPALIAKRSIVIAGHKTSVSLEDAFWLSLKEIAISRNLTLSNLVADIDSQRERGNLSSAIRLFVLQQFHKPAAAAWPSHAGSGAGAPDSTQHTGQSA